MEVGTAGEQRQKPKKRKEKKKRECVSEEQIGKHRERDGQRKKQRLRRKGVEHN